MNQIINLPSKITFRAGFIFILIAAPFSNVSSAEGERRAYVYHGSSISESQLKKSLRYYDTAAVTGFRITSRGKLLTARGPLMRNILKAVKESGRSWHPVITFTSARRGEKFLKSPAARKKALGGVRALVKRHGLKKIHLDFEYLKGSYASFLVVFLSEIKKNIQGLKISMALFPQVDFPGRWKAFHDPKLLAPLLDEAVIMCYDYHRPGSAPGPVTSLTWSEKNIRCFLRHLPREKLLLGIPAYGYLWSPEGKHITLSARFTAQCRHCRKNRHLKSGTLRVHITRKKKRYRGFVADLETRKNLRRLAQRYGLKGTALWRLGFEER